MTRINLLPVETLCDQHLLAEHRELKRIPNCLLSGSLKYDYADRSPTYVLGAGHVKFFTNKLGWLQKRYDLLHNECKKRGFNVAYHFRTAELIERGFTFNDWKASDDEIKINLDRVTAKMPVKARYTTPHD